MTMARQPLDKTRMLRALSLLDQRLNDSARLIIGGGAAMTLAYQHPIATQDVDAFAAKGGLRMLELDPVAREVADELQIEPDWLNAHFETFTAVLPRDYATRLKEVFEGKHLRVDALGPEDLLVMKCFAGRDKDRPHARKLLRLAKDLNLVDKQLEYLVEHRYLGAERAADYFDDLRDEAGL
jgi:predicted nucleotidyltransferase